MLFLLLHENDLAIIKRGDQNPIGNAALKAPRRFLGEAGWNGNLYQACYKAGHLISVHAMILTLTNRFLQDKFGLGRGNDDCSLGNKNCETFFRSLAFESSNRVWK